MPELTQQQWLEKALGGWVVNTKRAGVAHEILRDWPSSPQGLAVKALVEMLRELRRRVKEVAVPECLCGCGYGPRGESFTLVTLAAIDKVLEAARKAGLA